MRITYAFDNPMPSTKTDTEQLANTVAALARRGLSVDLLLPAQGAGPTADEIRRYYQVTGDFTVSLFPPTSTDRRTVQQVLHARRIASGPYLNGCDVVYTRQLVVVAQALRAGHRVAFEHYRPFGDQYPPVQPVLRTMMRHPRFVGAILHSEHARRSFERIGIPAERLLVAH
ncbi:MAG: hypothetical protein KC416_03660, partial [Myxococcales bacterium]|nr:hypothetical protein [Myxococcales bacterium]